jgi:hypothetical protein
VHGRKRLKLRATLLLGAAHANYLLELAARFVDRALNS